MMDSLERDHNPHSASVLSAALNVLLESVR